MTFWYKILKMFEKHLHFFPKVLILTDVTSIVFGTLFLRWGGQIKYWYFIDKWVLVLIILLIVTGSCKIDITRSMLVNSALILTLLKKVGLNLENQDENLPCIKAFQIEQYT